MKIVKVFNNNIVASITDDKKEVIVQGPGVGFQKKAGDLIDDTKVEKRFYIYDENRNKFYKLFETTPIEYFQISEEIMEKACKELNVELSSQFLIVLTDHISFSVERTKKGVYLPNLMMNEIKMLYPDEFNIGCWALDIIEEYTKVRLPVDEAAYIAMHIVSARLNDTSTSTINILMFIKGILNIIQNVFNINLDENNINIVRLKTHLKFLAQRVFKNIDTKPIDVPNIYNSLLNKNCKLNDCMNQINQFVWDTFEYHLSPQEQFYLLIHLSVIIQ